ncbi:hypothetical protein BDA96_03G474000 [Sorghum bicolor]|uniref:Pectinesterase inhibitor domain-containing protein n=2 Tax=Sorghum bicolor TaxID=4558 RepID=A0A921UR38_SORBI|nr:hypothetical protein BDA96_03G474000 [Sorghum bicolor]KXG34208.1 hypothetical protein SORBI_3003G441400 [Sorghum bicolor]
MAADLAAASGASACDAAAGMARRRDGEGEGDTDALEACGILYGAASAGIGCDAALEGSATATATAKARMAAANREFDQLSTMATALLNKLTLVT